MDVVDRRANCTLYAALDFFEFPVQKSGLLPNYTCCGLFVQQAYNNKTPSGGTFLILRFNEMKLRGCR